MGSVKDLTIITPATPNQMGSGRFFFSDRYSVFDWGEMPDRIPRKGEAIALLGAYSLGLGIPFLVTAVFTSALLKGLK